MRNVLSGSMVSLLLVLQGCNAARDETKNAKRFITTVEGEVISQFEKDYYSNYVVLKMADESCKFVEFDVVHDVAKFSGDLTLHEASDIRVFVEKSEKSNFIYACGGEVYFDFNDSGNALPLYSDGIIVGLKISSEKDMNVCFSKEAIEECYSKRS